MDPEIWGPHAWVFLHSVTIAYPENPSLQDKQNYKIFFNSLHKVLPCAACAHNYISHLQKIPLTDNILSDKDKLIKWLISIHNEVNKINNKKIVSYQDFIKIYENDYIPKNTNNNKLYSITFIVPIIFVLLLIIFFIIKNLNKKIQLNLVTY